MGFTCRCEDGGRGRDGVLHGLTLILVEAKAIGINRYKVPRYADKEVEYMIWLQYVSIVYFQL